MRVAPGNTEQAAGWDGDQGEFWAANADRLDLLVAGYDADLLDAADLAPADRVLDIGCGTGSVTLQAGGRVSAGSVLGVDLSAAMLATARARAAAAGLSNVRFEQCDAQLHAFGEQFDVVLSRTGTMFFADPVAAFANIRRALRPGGRLTMMLTWQQAGRNPWVTEVAAALTGGADAQQRARAILRRLLMERAGPAGVTLGSAAWLTTAERAA